MPLRREGPEMQEGNKPENLFHKCNKLTNPECSLQTTMNLLTDLTWRSLRWCQFVRAWKRWRRHAPKAPGRQKEEVSRRPAGWGYCSLGIGSLGRPA
jgi:hypothetical protein